jgi:hypothetical protein
MQQATGVLIDFVAFFIPSAPKGGGRSVMGAAHIRNVPASNLVPASAIATEESARGYTRMSP